MSRICQGLAVVCLAAVVMVSAGCATWSTTQRHLVRFYYPHADSPTLTQDADDHLHSVERVSAIDTRAIIDDLDLFFLTDRPTRLTKWHDR